MTAVTKLIIESIFRDSILQVCKKYAVAIHQVSLRIRTLEKGKQSLELLKEDVLKQVIPFDDLMHPKMLVLRFNTVSIKLFFECIHHAFMLEKKCVNPQRISLVFYQSQAVDSPCIGIMYDEKPIKSLRIADLFDAMNIGYEQLN